MDAARPLRHLLLHDELVWLRSVAPAPAERVRARVEAHVHSHLFRRDLREVSTVGLDDERKALVIEPADGVRTIERS